MTCGGALLLCAGLAFGQASTPGAADAWLASPKSGLVVSTVSPGQWQANSPNPGESFLDSILSYPAKPGESFEVTVRLKADLEAMALPELACFDAAGHEIAGISALDTGPQYATTYWQEYHRIFPTRPGTASVRARLHLRGRGSVGIAGLVFRRKAIDHYQTGALISQPHPRTRGGVVLESNHGIVNRELVSDEDRDGDGKWALVTVDLDRLTQPQQKGEDWRTGFEDNPNAILWSDGAVLKSDTVAADRAPDIARALHFRMQVHQGPYAAYLSDPGRVMAVSLDGVRWQRYPGGREISLGTLEMRDGRLEFWVDACDRDPVSVGPVYFDYVRLMPTLDAPSVERLFNAAKLARTQLARGSADARKVDVTVRGTPFAGGADWPVGCGLPIPQGELLSAERVTVLDPGGQPIPSQNAVTATWSDGSVKWLYVNFRHDFSKTGEAHYTVVYGNRQQVMAPPQGVHLLTTTEGLEVDTGAIRFTISKRHFGLLENVRRADGSVLQREPIAAEIVEAGGKVWHGLEAGVDHLVVEQAGPLHAVVRVDTPLAASGKPSSGFYHRVRIHAYANSPLVQLDYFVANMDSRPAGEVGGSMASKVEVKSIILRVRPSALITGAQHSLGRASASGRLVQTSGEAGLVGWGGDTKALHQRIPGWVSLALDPSGSLSIGVDHFAEQFPKALRWTPQEAQVALWADEGDPYSWIEGVGKTHRLSLYYGPPGATDATLLTAGPALALAAPEWYAHSGAFGPQITAAESGLPAVEQTLAAQMRQYLVDHVGLGFENYGDHSSNGYVKGAFLWDNNEYDTPAGCLVQFARTGDRAALQLGLAGALHYVDVDMIHYSSQHADWVMAQHVHSHALFGHHTAQGPDMHHAGFVQGLIWYSDLTGDPSGLEGARGIADWVLRNTRVQTGSMERAIGHPLMTTNDVYEATGEEQYLRGAARLVDQALKWEHPERSGFLAPITESPAYYSGSPFNNGLLSAGLMKFNSWARLPEIDALLARFGQWTLTDVWRPPDGLLHKAGSPRANGNPRYIASNSRLMAYLYARTQDPFFLVVPRALLVAAFGEHPTGFEGTRDAGLVYNYVPWFLTGLKDAQWPTPEPQLEVTLEQVPTTLPRGAHASIVVAVRNSGSTKVENVRASLHSRLDLTVSNPSVPPEEIAPGQTVRYRYEIQAPANLNLTSAYNRVAYAHWSTIYERAGRPHLARQSFGISIQP